MGDRYILTEVCPECGYVGDDVYFAPTCGFVEWTCPQCGHVVNLIKQTGIPAEQASNADMIAQLCDALLNRSPAA